MQVKLPSITFDLVRAFAQTSGLSDEQAICQLLQDALEEQSPPDETDTQYNLAAIRERIDKYGAVPQFRIVQSDCIAFLKSLPSDSVDLIVTDPAYSGMNQYLKLGRGKIIGHYQSENNDKWFKEFHDEPENYRIFLSECHRVLKSNRHIYIMFDSFSLLTLAPIVREVFDVKNVLVWDKVNLGMGHYFRRRHEHIVFASKGKRRISRRDIPDIWAYKRVHRAPYPTQKPVELFERMIESSAEAGFTVCDPFVGSGSAAIAALKRGCHFVGCDMAARAVDFATKRCEQFLSSGTDEFSQIVPQAANEQISIDFSE